MDKLSKEDKQELLNICSDVWKINLDDLSEIIDVYVDRDNTSDEVSSDDSGEPITTEKAIALCGKLKSGKYLYAEARNEGLHPKDKSTSEGATETTRYIGAYSIADNPATAIEKTIFKY